MRDIVERLQILTEHRSTAPATTREAAEEIERLRSRIEYLRSLITTWVDADDDPEDIDGPYHAAWLALRKEVGR